MTENPKKEADSFDLSELVPVERVIDILSPGRGEKIGLKVTLIHLADEELEATKRKFIDRKLKLQARGKQFDARDIQANEQELLFRAVKGWEWAPGLTFEGEKPDFNRQNFVKVIKKFPWIQDQLNEQMVDNEAFFTR